MAATVRKAGRKALVLQADVAKEQPVKRMVAKLIRTFGRIDILVNNAGIVNSAPVEEMAVAMWDEMIAVNLRSVFLCTHYVLPHMYRRDYGRIVSTASQVAYLGSPGLSHYCAAKGAIISFTRALSREIGTRNVNANCVAPGATHTAILKDIPEPHLDAIRAGSRKGWACYSNCRN